MVSSISVNVKRSIGKYPRIVFYPTEKLAVLLTGTKVGKATGFVVNSAHAAFKVGDFSEGWDEAASIDLDGSITLKNE